MLVRRDDRESREIEGCHEGRGLLHCTEMLADYAKGGAGFKFIHDNVLEPGATIGEHTHKNDEEIYVILDGRGVMRIDGVDQDVAGGDVCITRAGHSHSLTNSPDTPMHLLVVGINL